jgi:predicted dehydrogenase
MVKLSVALIGCGNIAGGFDEKRQESDSGIYSHAGAYKAHGGFELRTVFDTVPTRAQKFLQFWDAKSASASVQDICKMQHDVISICTPDDTHYEYLEAILDARCCRTVFIEKPFALKTAEIAKIARRSEETGIKLIANFQRRHDPTHQALRRLVTENPTEVLSVVGHYMKGLKHIGVTMIDTLCFICGCPQAVLSFNRVFHQDVAEYSYEFILFYPDFTVSVKTTDSAHFAYTYHLFEIDLLLAQGRNTLVDISQGLRVSPVTGYAYSGVKILNDRESVYQTTGYNQSMVAAVAYVHDVTTGAVRHTINTPQASYNNALIIDAIIESYEKGSIRINLESASWKK